MTDRFQISVRTASPARVFICALVIFVILASVSIARAAQQSPNQQGSSRIAAIAATGSKKFSSDQIAASTGLRAGQMITRDDLQHAADRLSQLGPFATVRYRFASTEGDVKLDYEVSDEPTVPVTFDNFPQLTDGEITQALKKDVILFDGTAPEHGTILDDMARTIQKLLEDRLVQTTVSHQLTVATEGTQSVQEFRAEGPVPTIASVTFSDALAGANRGVQTSLADLIGKPFSRSVLQLFELEQVRPLYISRGFLNVHFDSPAVKLNLNPGNASASTVVITAAIVPGPAFTWNGVMWIGAQIIPSAQLDALFPLKSGDVADGLKIEGAWDRVRDAYAHLGYLDANLDIVPQFDDAAKHVAYVVTIKEGPQYRMGKLVLSGLSVDGDRRIREAWKITEGAFFDKTQYDEFLDSGVKSAFFGLPIHYDKIGRFLQEDPKTGTVDVLLDFQ